MVTVGNILVAAGNLVVTDVYHVEEKVKRTIINPFERKAEGDDRHSQTIKEGRVEDRCILMKTFNFL